jgi:ABC-type uncharacterized transport system permease subunit
MKAVNPPSRARRIIGDILLVLAILLFADVIVVMLHKINAVVLNAYYQEVFQYKILYSFLTSMTVYFCCGREKYSLVLL